MTTQNEVLKRKNMKWNDRMDKILVETLIDEVVKGGKKPDNGWRPETLNRVISEVRNGSGEAITQDNVRARLKTMKKEYLAIRQALNQSGFALDPDINCIIADEDAWARYIEAHKDANGLRNKPLKFYESWQIIIGNEQATGDRAVEAHDFSPNVPDDFSPNAPARETTSPSPSPSVPVPEGLSSSSLTPAPPVKSKKRARALETDITHGVAGMVEAANRIAATFEGPDWEKINAAFEAIPELEEDAAHLAADLFNSNPWMARYFLSLSEGRRFGWLKGKLKL